MILQESSFSTIFKKNFFFFQIQVQMIESQQLKTGTRVRTWNLSKAENIGAKISVRLIETPF